jgi:hypothetical protein
MVLEHQTGMHNQLARAVLEARVALYQETELNREMGNPAGYRFESTTRRIRSAGDSLLQYMLFVGESRLTARIEGATSFTRDFVRQGPRDSRGRSLRDLNLRTRLFTYPCSYLVYSSAFDALPQPVHEYVLHRLWDVLTGKDSGAEFAHLSATDRKAILEILRETKPGLPGYWKAPG